MCGLRDEAIGAAGRKEVRLKLRITIAGKTYEAEVEVLEDESTETYLPAPTYVPAAGSAGFVAAELNGSADGEDGVCLSPVTGLVIRVPVEVGQAVEAGQLLMVLEAMKMETQLTAPRAGLVRTVHVAAGNSVKVNQVLVELD
jgi:methylmalonyl-CoA carboxyltransferase small subunit